MSRLYLLICLSFWTATSYASPALDLWQVWQLAQQNDPIYAAQQASTQANQEQIVQARAELLPSIDAVAGINHNDIRRASRLNQSQHNQTNTWQLRLSQPLLDLSAIARFERSRYLAAISVLDSELAKQDLMLRVANAYFDQLAAEDTLNSLHAQQRAVEHQKKAAELAFELGGATITDSLEAQSRLDLLHAQTIAAEQELERKKAALQRLAGRENPVLFALDPNAPLAAPEPLQVQAWLSQAFTHNLRIAKAQFAVQAQHALLESNKKEHAPTIALQARSSSHSNTGIHGIGTSPRALDSSIGVELSIPIYRGGATSSRVRENASILQQRNLEKENARRATQEAIYTHFSGVVKGLQEVSALQAAERSSAAAVKANETAYSIGVRVTVDVLNAQQQLYETQRALSLARYTMLMHSLQLKHNAGQLHPQDLQAINQLLQPPTTR